MDAAREPADPIRVIVVDDEPLVRSGLAAILDVEDDLTVVGEGADGADVPALVRERAPDVVLLDVRMPGIDGVSATRRLTAAADAPAVVVVTTFESDAHVRDALLAGARGFVLKRARPEELVAAVRTAARGDALVVPEAIRRLVAPSPPARAPGWVDRLTPRERDVLALLVRGATNAEAAAALVVSIETVKTHVKALLEKTGARHRTELVVRAFEAGAVAPGTAPGRGGAGPG